MLILDGDVYFFKKNKCLPKFMPIKMYWYTLASLVCIIPQYILDGLMKVFFGVTSPMNHNLKTISYNFSSSQFKNLFSIFMIEMLGLLSWTNHNSSNNHQSKQVMLKCSPNFISTTLKGMQMHILVFHNYWFSNMYDLIQLELNNALIIKI